MEKINSRGRRRILTEGIQRAIKLYHGHHKDWSAQKILNKIYNDLFLSLKDKHPEYSDADIKALIELPGLNSVQRFIRENCPKDVDIFSPLKKPWHLGLSNGYSAEAIYYIQSVQKWLDMNWQRIKVSASRHAWDMGDYVPIVSEIEAKWIARLYLLVKDIPQKGKQQNEKCLKLLCDWSRVYAINEIVCKNTNTHIVDTTELDKALRRGKEPLVIGPTYYIELNDKTLIDKITTEVLVENRQRTVKNERPHSSTE